VPESVCVKPFFLDRKSRFDYNYHISTAAIKIPAASVRRTSSLPVHEGIWGLSLVNKNDKISPSFKNIFSREGYEVTAAEVFKSFC
jgi:hypothetical protein